MRIAIAGLLALVACGGSAPTPIAAPAPAPPVVAKGDCKPYLVGVDLQSVDTPPAAYLALAGPLEVVAVVDGVFEVAAVGHPGLRGYVLTGGATAQLADDRELEPGVRGLRGGEVEIDRAVDGGVTIWGPQGRGYQVPCEALASAPIDDPARPPEPVWTAGDAYVHADNGEDVYRTLSEPVEVLADQDDQVRVRIRVDGFEVTGSMDRSVLRPYSIDDMELRYGRDPREVSGPLAARKPAAWCGDEANLRGGAAVSSGPATEASSRELFRTVEPASVRVVGSEGDARLIQIDYPIEPIAHAIGWVVATDLDHPTCAP